MPGNTKRRMTGQTLVLLVMLSGAAMVPISPSYGDAAQTASEATAAASSSVPGSGSVKPVLKIPEIDKEALLKTLDTAEKQLEETSRKLSDSDKDQRMLELTRKLLRVSRARLLGDSSAAGTEAMSRQMLELLELSQQRLGQLRKDVAGSPNDEKLLQQIETAQQQLNQTGGQSQGSRLTTPIQPTTTAQLRTMLETAQQSLDEARKKAAMQPDNKATLRQLEQLQEQLDEAKKVALP